jgi:hypothetical protein
VRPGGLGHDELRDLVRERVLGEPVEAIVRVPLGDGATITRLERGADVIGRTYENGTAEFRVTIGERLLERLVAGGLVEHAPAG